MNEISYHGDNFFNVMDTRASHEHLYHAHENFHRHMDNLSKHVSVGAC